LASIRHLNLAWIMRFMKRLGTGAAGLDELLGGGLQPHTAVLVTGGCGLGKTVFCLGFLAEGAENKEPGVLACFNESPAKMRAYAKGLGWDLAALEKKRLLLVVDAATARHGLSSQEEHVLTRFEFDDALNYVLSACAKTKAKRLAIDSLSSMPARVENRRNALFKLAASLEQAQVTAVLTAEPLGGDEGFVEEHVADTVLSLRRAGEKRLLQIKKHRGSAHSLHEHPYAIGLGGLAVEKAEFKL